MCGLDLMVHVLLVPQGRRGGGGACCPPPPKWSVPEHPPFGAAGEAVHRERGCRWYLLGCEALPFPSLALDGGCYFSVGPGCWGLPLGH